MKMVAFRTFVRTPTAHLTDAASSSETNLIYQGKMSVRMKTTPRPFEALLGHTDEAVKRPRGRPPLGAVLDENGAYVLQPESVEAAAQRLKLQRERCRARYRATRQALQKAKAFHKA